MCVRVLMVDNIVKYTAEIFSLSSVPLFYARRILENLGVESGNPVDCVGAHNAQVNKKKLSRYLSKEYGIEVRFHVLLNFSLLYLFLCPSLSLSLFALQCPPCHSHHRGTYLSIFSLSLYIYIYIERERDR